VKSNIDTSRTADINFSCLLCLCRQRLQKIIPASLYPFYIDLSIAILKFLDHSYNISIEKFTIKKPPT